MIFRREKRIKSSRQSERKSERGMKGRIKVERERDTKEKKVMEI